MAPDRQARTAQPDILARPGGVPLPPMRLDWLWRAGADPQFQKEAGEHHMTVLDWPKLPPADQDALRAGLCRLLTEIMDGELHAVDNLDDLFARTVAALVALLDEHPPDSEVVTRVHQFLNQPLNLLWWHPHQWAGNAVHIDDVAIWTMRSPCLDRREFFMRPWSRLLKGESYK